MSTREAESVGVWNSLTGGAFDRDGGKTEQISSKKFVYPRGRAIPNANYYILKSRLALENIAFAVSSSVNPLISAIFLTISQT